MRSKYLWGRRSPNLNLRRFIKRPNGNEQHVTFTSVLCAFQGYVMEVRTRNKNSISLKVFGSQARINFNAIKQC